MRLGLAARLALLFTVLVAGTALATSFVGIASANQQVRADVDRFLESRAEEIVDGTRQQPRDRRGDRKNSADDATTLDEIEEQADNLAVDFDAVVQTVDASGNVAASSGLTLPVSDDDKRLARAKGSSILKTVAVNGTDYRIATAAVEGGGVVMVARPLDATIALTDLIRNRILVLGLGLSAIAGVLGWVLARQTLLPLRRLTTSIETIASTQDLSTPVAVERTDEIGRLSRSFDKMLSALSLSRDQQHRLVQDAAHELRTPLTSINANVDLLAHAPDLDPEVRLETLTGIRSELRQLSTLFTEIIELATDDRDRMPHEPVDLRAIAEAGVERTRRRFDNPINLTIEAGTGATGNSTTSNRVLGNPAELERALGNLLHNAAKYSPAGSPIDVKLAGTSVSVRDSGPGIPEADRARVFDRFFRTESARSTTGSGLGLAIVAKIVQEHGGSTFVRSPDGPGVEVGFDLPALHST